MAGRLCRPGVSATRLRLSEQHAGTLPVGFRGGTVAPALLLMPRHITDAARGQLLVKCRRAIVGQRGPPTCQRCPVGSLRGTLPRDVESLLSLIEMRPRNRVVFGQPAAPSGQFLSPRSRLRRRRRGGRCTRSLGPNLCHRLSSLSAAQVRRVGAKVPRAPGDWCSVGSGHVRGGQFAGSGELFSDVVEFAVRVLRGGDE